jgi:hypothetical protein
LERLRIVEELEASRRILHESIHGISEQDAARCEAKGRWSVRDCVEHLTLAERGLFGRIEREPAEPLPANPERERRAVGGVANRAGRIEAPERARPNGRFASLAEALAAFDALREVSIGFAREKGEELASLTALHPMFGPLTGAEMLLVMAGHVRRHAEQIREIRAALAA